MSASIGDCGQLTLSPNVESDLPEYEARIVMGVGLRDVIVPIESADDVTAKQAAELLVECHDVELWRGESKLGTLHHYMRPAPAVAKPPTDVIPLRFFQKVKVRAATVADELTHDEFDALRQLSKSFSRGTIVPPISSRLVELGYAKEYMDNLMITDSGLSRLASGIAMENAR
jgi:hypothetical protein